MKLGIFSAILSVLVPGSGQLFLGRYPQGAAFFAVFVACLWTAPSRAAVFLVCLLSGLECLYRGRGLPFSFSRRYLIYLVFAFAGFVFWFLGVSGDLLFGDRAFAATVADQDLVDLRRIDFTIDAQMVFSGEHNVAGKKLLPENRCILRQTVAKALARVQQNLQLRGLGLRVFDCYHPLSTESKFLESVPTNSQWYRSKDNALYRGASLDAILIQDGAPVLLPYEYPWAAHARDGEPGRNRGRGFTGHVQKKALSNGKILCNAMKQEGFLCDAKHPWYFRYNIWEQFAPSDIPFSQIP